MSVLFNRDNRSLFIILCLSQITISFNLAAVAAVIPSISRELNFPDVQVARIIPHYLWAYGLGALMYAPLTRRFSINKILASALFVFSLTSLYCGLTQSLNVLLIANLINGCAAASVVPLGLMTIGRQIKKEMRGRAVGLFFSASFISSLVGVLASGVIHWSFLFIIPFILGIITIILIYLLKVSQLSQCFSGRIDYVGAIRDRSVVKVFSVIFVMSLLYHGVYKWYGVYLDREYHLAQPAISALILMTSISGALGQNIGGAVTDFKGRIFAVEFGLCCLGLATCLLSAKFSVAVVAFILALVSAGWTIAHNGVSTVLTDLPDRFRAELASLNSSVRFLSGGLGFYLSGFLVQKSFSLNFFVNGLLVLILVLVARFALTVSSKEKSAADVLVKEISY